MTVHPKSISSLVVLAAMVFLIGCNGQKSFRQAYSTPLEGLPPIGHALYGDSLFIVSDDHFILLDIATGKKVWQYHGNLNLSHHFTHGGMVAPDVLVDRSQIWLLSHVTEHGRAQKFARMHVGGLQIEDVPLSEIPIRLYSSIEDDDLVVATPSRMGLLVARRDSFIWEKTEWGGKDHLQVLEQGGRLAVADKLTDSLFLLDKSTGVTIASWKFPIESKGMPLSGIAAPNAEEIWLGMYQDVFGVKIGIDKPLWSYHASQPIRHAISLSGGGILICTHTSDLVKLHAGQAMYSSTRYACGGDRPAMPVIHPQNGRIALLSHCPDHLGVVVLDPETLEERYFIPGPSQENISPILWGDLLIHFPAGENVVRAVRLPD